MFAIHPVSFLDFGSCTKVVRLQFWFFRSSSSFFLPFTCLSCPQSCLPPTRQLPRPVALGFAFLFLPTLGTKASGRHECLSEHTHQTKDIHTEWTIYIRYGEGIHTRGTTHSWDIHTDGTTYGWDYTRMELYTNGTIHGWDTHSWDYIRMGLHMDRTTYRLDFIRMGLHTDGIHTVEIWMGLHTVRTTYG